MNPGTFNVFKKSAAAKIGLILPTFNEKGWLSQNGAILIEAAKASGTDNEGNILYGWQDKVVIALGMNDICFILENPETRKIVHSYKGKTKSISFREGTDSYAGTWMMSILEKPETGDPRSVTVSFTAGEFAVLGVLIKHAAPKIVGW